MFLAEWKKILRQRWFLGLLLVLLILNMAIYVYQQKNIHADWLATVPWYEEYLEQCDELGEEEAVSLLTGESMRFSDFYMISLALAGEIDESILEVLQMENPDILDDYKASVYGDHPEEMMGRSGAAAALLTQYGYGSSYPDYLTSIRTNYERMRDNGFYDNRPYSRALGEKTVEDFSALEGTEISPGMEYGVRSLMENSTADLMILILSVCVCAMTVMQERGRELFGLLKSCKHGRAKLAAVKLLTAASASAVLCVLFYGSLTAAASQMYGFGPLDRPMQSVGILQGSSRTLTVGGFLLDSYLKSTLAIASLTCLSELLMFCLKNAVLSMGIILLGGIVCFALYETISPTSGAAWLHLLNPVEWLSRLEGYGSYYCVNLFGEPVNIITVNFCLVCILLAASCVGGIIVFSAGPITDTRARSGFLARITEKAAGKLPYPGSLFGQEWGKQLWKNRLLLLLILAGAAVWVLTEKEPVTLDREGRQYQAYVETYGGPMTSETMEALEEERARIEDLEAQLTRYGERLADGEITEEQYTSACLILENRLEVKEPFERVYAQAQKLLAYEEATGIRLYLADEYMGEYLLEQREYDQLLGAIAMLAMIVLLSGLFPGEQKNQMLNLLRASRLGTAPLFVVKTALGMVLSALTAVGIYLSRLISAQTLYGFSEWQMPVQSFSAARELSVKMSLSGFCLSCGILTAAGACCLAAVFLALTMWMRNRLYAILSGTAVFVLPLALGAAGIGFPWKFSGNRVFFFLNQTAEDGFGSQIGYLAAAALTAAAAMALAWRKYQNRPLWLREITAFRARQKT